MTLRELQAAQSGPGENAEVLLVFLPSTQSEERKRIDELIESGKEEGMKVRGSGAYCSEAEAGASPRPCSSAPSSRRAARTP